MSDISNTNINTRLLRKFDLNTLLVLHTLLETRSVSETARALHLGQPAISHVLKRLREHLADPLLLRQGRQYLLSSHAEALRAPLADCLIKAQALIAPPREFDPAQAEAELSLSMPDLVEMVLLPELIDSLMKDAPGLRLRIESTMPDELEDSFASGRIDAALGYFPIATPHLARQRLFSTGIRCFYHPERLQLTEPLDATTLAAIPHISTRYAGVGGGLVDAWFQKQGLARHVIVSTASFQPIATLLAKQPAIVFLPDMMEALLGPELASLPFPDPTLRLPIELAWHPRHSHDPLHAFLRQKLVEITMRMGEGKNPGSAQE